MDRQVNLYEAKTHLSRLVDEAAHGHTIVIAKGGRPMARLGPVSAGRTQPRTLGQLARRSRDVDWTAWWRDWKAADGEIQADFEAAARRRLPATRRARKRQTR
jgi:prevent-host-death family protein